MPLANSTPVTVNATQNISWDFAPVYSIVIIILTVLGNGFILFLYCYYSKLHSPFAVYVINLLISNILGSLIQTPMDVYVRLTRRKSFSSLFCSFHVYCTYMLTSTIPVAHVLITLNRVWAIAAPLSYRKHHSYKMAVAVCVGMWVFLNAYIVPFVVIDGLYHRTPADNAQCTANQDWSNWVVGNRSMFYISTEFIILFAYPYFVCQRRQRLKARTALSKVTPAISTTAHESARMSQESPQKAAFRASARSFFVLTLLTANVAICWTPMNVFFLSNRYITDPEFYKFAKLIKLTFSAIDPVLFAVAIQDLRDACLNIFRCAK